MWAFFALKVLKNRIGVLVALLLITIFMCFEASKTQLSYESPRILPVGDSTNVQYRKFKQLFGEDGNAMLVGFSDENLFRLDRFNNWYDFTKQLEKEDGVELVVSVSNLHTLYRNDSLRQLEFKPIVSGKPRSQAELDTLKQIILSLPFYKNLIYNPETNTTLIAIFLEQDNLNTGKRGEIVEDVKEITRSFAEKNKLDLHLSGLPYIRTEFKNRIGYEMILFLVLAILVTSGLLYLFFRSFSPVFLSLAVVLTGVIWSLGTIVLFGYKITVLSGLIPPLIIVIGVPNCIFLINKYQGELRKCRNKGRALVRMIQGMGLTLFLANVTTAIGFGVFYFTDSPILVEFGVVAAINVMTTYLITIVLIPIALSYLFAPAVTNAKQLYAERIKKILGGIDYLVHYRRRTIYLIITVLVIIGAYGMTKIRVIGYVVDDLPQNDPLYTDLKFFEGNFKGVLPFEISIDSKKNQGIFAGNASSLYKTNALEKLLGEYPEFSRPVSIAEALKFSYQAYRGGDPKYYVLPAPGELKKMASYAPVLKQGGHELHSFMDSNQRYMRVSLQMADVGSVRAKELVSTIKPRIDSIFSPKDFNVLLTGHSLMFMKSNDYLLKNLIESLLIEIILITIVGLVLFRSVRIIILSKLPCLIPLLITAGLMGFMHITFKASTILIFTIAFGIASDGTIYFLAKYRHEYKNNGKSISDAVTYTIHETGFSMIYTAIVLFCGFFIFTASGFGGTAALGILLSVTLLVSMITNLLLLPAILLSLDPDSFHSSGRYKIKEYAEAGEAG